MIIKIFIVGKSTYKYLLYHFFRCPFYNELKLLFLYMTYPTSDSSLTYVYRNIISPFLKKHEKVIIVCYFCIVFFYILIL